MDGVSGEEKEIFQEKEIEKRKRGRERREREREREKERERERENKIFEIIAILCMEH